MSAQTIREAHGAVVAAGEHLDMMHTHQFMCRRILVRLLSAARKAQDISYRDLARQIECSAATLHDIEQGRRWSERIVARWVEVANGWTA